MDYIDVTVLNDDICIKNGTTYEDLAKKYERYFQAPIMLAKNGNLIRELTSPVENGAKIEFYDTGNIEGMRTYMRSVSFLMIKVIKDLLGYDTIVKIENSINKNYYCEIYKEGIVVDDALVEKIEEEMKKAVDEDIPIAKETFTRRNAIKKVLELGMPDKAKLFKYRRASTLNLYRLGNFYDCFYGYMVPSTKYLYLFKLMKYENGLIIRFPDMKDVRRIKDFVRLEKISQVFMEQMVWGRLMAVKDVGDLNEIIVSGKFGELVRINEALHEKKVASIADLINERKDETKIVLIAGPSSSGKTTFANRLSVQLRVLGIKPHIISMDDYFIDRDKTPIDEFGKRDLENINCIDIKKFNTDLKNMIKGQTVELPSYNFLTGTREYKGNNVTLKQDDIVVIEGIHGLNDVLTAEIPNKNKFKIFISAMTQLNIDDHNFISTSDSRLLRRIVRDNLFRGSDAISTIAAWEYVVRGEERNIFPFQENADVMFNSATIFEIAVLKQYAEPLLFKVSEDLPEYVTAKRLIKFLEYFLSAPAETIPNNSIIREFVGGSVFNV